MEGFTKETITDCIIILDKHGFPQQVVYALVYWMPQDLLERLNECVPYDLKITCNGCKYHVISEFKKTDTRCLIPEIYDILHSKHIGIMKNVKTSSDFVKKPNWIK
jgi:hypothetical protein